MQRIEQWTMKQWVAGIAVALGVFGPACGDDGQTPDDGGGGSSTEGGGAPSGPTTTGATTTGGDGGAGGQGGSGGGEPQPTGLPGTDFVSSGERATSPSYKMVFTLGQSTQNQGKTTSRGYRMQGGLQGTNGSLP
jgi:hypothetical protein